MKHCFFTLCVFALTAMVNRNNSFQDATKMNDVRSTKCDTAKPVQRIISPSIPVFNEIGLAQVIPIDRDKAPYEAAVESGGYRYEFRVNWKKKMMQIMVYQHGKVVDSLDVPRNRKNEYDQLPLTAQTVINRCY